MELITISRLKSARRCPRHHCYSYEMGRRPIIVSEPLFFGSLFHVGLEQWWLAWMEMRKPMPEGSAPHAVEHALHMATTAMRAKFAGGSDGSSATPYDLVRAEELMLGYHYRWSDFVKTIIVIGVESAFETPLINPVTGRSSQTYRTAGKIDVRIKLWDSTFRIIEHKTTTADITPGSDYWLKLRMDGQISQYHDGAASLGDDVQGCIYDVAKRPLQKPYLETPDDDKKFTQGKPERPGKPCRFHKDAALTRAKADGRKLLVKDIPNSENCELCTQPRDAEPPRLYSGQHDHDETIEEFRARLRLLIAESPDAYYQHGEIVRLDEEMDEFRLDVWMSAKMVRDRQLAARELGVRAWPRNPDACNAHFSLCEYHGVCTGSANIDDDHLFRSTEAQHEELG